MVTSPEFWETYVRERNPNNNAILIDNEDFFAVISKRYDNAFVNQARYVRGEPQKILERIINLFDEYDKSFSLAICDHNTTANLKATALDMGFEKTRSFDRMLARPDEIIVPDENIPYSIEIIDVDSLLDDTFLKIKTRCFPQYYQSIQDTRNKLARRIKINQKDDNRTVIHYGAFDQEGEPVGMASLTYDSEIPETATLSGAAVLPSHRKNGIYNKLLGIRSQDAGNNGCSYLHIFANSSTSTPIVRRKGFSTVETITFYDYINR